MDFYRKVRAQQDQVDDGTLKVSVFTEDGTRPVENALVRISYTGESGQTVEEVRTDPSGQTPILDLKTPPLEYSMEPVEEQPYAEYTIQVEAEGFENMEIAGTQVLPGVQAQQAVRMAFRAEASFERLVIGPHTLFAEYPPKIEEAEIKPIDESGEIVLSRVVIPEYIVVHDGSVNDTTASNYYVRYKDYIKNVASSEIYATWPDDTIRANVLAIMSFTLNRVYTEWYRNKGYDFTITSSTAYDHKWIRGRNVFDSISRIVDELFENYLSIQEIRFPDKFDYQINIPEELMTYMVPKFLLQPFVENSISHGLERSVGKGTLYIEGKEKNGILYFLVEDNGKGIPEEKLKDIQKVLEENTSSEYFAVSNINSLIKLKYGSGYGVTITSKYEEWTKVQIVMPANMERV